jgi:hypothetical protein
LRTKTWHTLLFIFTLSVAAVAQEPAVFSCIQVNADGGTTLWFQSPPSAADVEQYLIFYSTTGSSYNEIAAIPGGASGNISYTHLNAQANTGTRYYYIETVYSNNSFTSGILQTIYLQLDNHDPDFNQADLFWNTISNPLPPGSLTSYNVYWDYPGGSWNLVASTEELSYSMPVIVCHDSINFKIEIENTNGCSSVSNIRGNWFKNVVEPPAPLIDSISVDADGHIVIGWEPVPMAAAYIIYLRETIWNPIDTVYGLNNTFYVDFDSDGCRQRIGYTVAIIDTCGNTGIKDQFELRKNMLIDTLIFNTCDASITINWTKYHPSPENPDPDNYQIFVSQDGGPFQKAGEVASSETTFTHTNVSNGVGYTYYVHAEFSTGSSTTCRKTIVTHEYIEPRFIYLANADVAPSQEIELTAEVDLSVVAGKWEIYRTNPGASNALKIASIKRSEINSSPLIYLDKDIDPSLGPYIYLIKVLDSCGFEKLESNTLKTIHLSGEIVDEQTNHLQWTAFKGWDAPVEKYYIFRMMGEQEPVLPIDSVDAQTFEYTDDYSSLGNVDGRFVYWVQAKEQNGNAYGFNERSRSNRLNLFLESQVYFANAFKPGGINSVFKPIFRFFSGTAYTFQIYNRWGQLVFETSDPEAGWTGEYKGERAAQGVYIYQLSYRDVYSQFVVLRGTVTLLQ